MKLFLAGLVCCALGVMLFAVNWLGAVSFAPHITEWDTPPGRIGAAYSVVGYRPTIFGVVFILAGLALLIVPQFVKARAGESQRI